jgi:PAS domain S-box-containing protein
MQDPTSEDIPALTNGLPPSTVAIGGQADPWPEPGAAQRDTLPLSAAGLGLIFAVAAAGYGLFVREDGALVLAGVAAATALVLLGLAIASSRWTVPSRWTGPLEAIIWAAILLNILLLLYVNAEPAQTISLVLLILVAGVLFMDRWFYFVLSATLAGWTVVVLLKGPTLVWFGYGLILLTAAGLATRVHTSRIISLRRQKDQRRQLRQREIALDAALQTAQERGGLYRGLLDNANDLVQSVAPDGSLLYVNRAWRESLGYDEEEIPGLSIFEIVHPDRRVHCESAFRRVLAGESVRVMETIFVTNDGQQIVLEGNMSCRSDGGSSVATVGVFRDISNRKRMEAALRASEENLRALLESASQGILLVPNTGRIDLVNASIEQMFGYERQELIGQPVEILLPGRFHEIHAEHRANYFLHPRTRTMGTDLELMGRRKDGTEFPVDVSLSYIKVAEEILALSFVTDITERKRDEKVLRDYSERLADMVEERTSELREAQARLLSQQRLQQELELAEAVQASLLPRQVPSFEGFDFSAMALPARYVSGDLYDFILSSSGSCHIVLADIAGKGIPAAMLTSTARALLRAEIEHDSSPASILMNVGMSLYEDLAHAEVFITVFLSRLDAELGALTYANAGHTEALWRHSGTETWHPLTGTGLPLGILANSPIDAKKLFLRPGDVVLFYSDGITEAANPDQELFGLDRLVTLLGEHANLSALGLAQKIVDAVEDFREDIPLSDDLTLIVLKALPRNISFAHPAALEHLQEASALVRQNALAFGANLAYQMELAASEIITNIIRHAYRVSSGEIRGHLALLPDRIQLDLYDDGLPFDPAEVPLPDLSTPHEGGYGLAIARQIADELLYTPGTADGNHWRLVKLAGNDIAGDLIEDL